jgi:hypothetical protein
MRKNFAKANDGNCRVHNQIFFGRDVLAEREKAPKIVT